MKLNIIKTGMLLLVLLLVSCKATIESVSDYSDKANFNNYKTFAFAKEHWTYLSQLDQDRIFNTIEKELNKQGLKKSYNPDLMISIITGKEDLTKVHNNITYAYGYWDDYPISNMQVIKSTEGTLTIHLVDTKTQKLVWEGKGNGVIRKNYNKAEKEKRIKDFVVEILSKYPPNRISKK